MCDKPYMNEAWKRFTDPSTPDTFASDLNQGMNNVANEATQQEATMSFESKACNVLDESKEVLIGAGIGLAYGGVVSTLVIAQSCVQIAVYPVYMANCAVRPFLNLLTPLWLPAFTTFVGACGGLGAKLSK